MTLIKPDEYISEAEVLAKWPMLKASELRKARKDKRIGCYRFRDGPCYTAEQVQAYIDQTYLQETTCADRPTEPNPLARLAEIPPTPARPLSSMDGTSTGHTQAGAMASMPAGMTQELASSAAALLEQQIGKRPKSDSPRSSSRHRQPQGPRSLALIKS